MVETDPPPSASNEPKTTTTATTTSDVTITNTTTQLTTTNTTAAITTNAASKTTTTPICTTTTNTTTTAPPASSVVSSLVKTTTSATATTTATNKNLKTITLEIQNDQKRRSSSRSIKRKRFDDEIVEYSTTFPQSRGGSSGAGTDSTRGARPRTTSQNYVTPAVTVPVPPILPAPAGTGSVTDSNSGTPISTDTVVVTQATGTSVATTSTTTASVVSSVANLTPLLSSTPQAASATVAAHTMERNATSERRRSGRGNNNKRARRTNGRPTSQVVTKDLGRWKPIDDLALVIGIQQTNDLRMVHRGVKFSCKFTLQELQTRWYALLFEPSISRIAVSAMRNLHPELIESVQRKALFSVQEEELLGTIKSVETPKLEHFQELLDKNASVFYSARTAKSLQNHWMLMKQYCLLPDQAVKPVQNNDPTMTFSDAEDQIFDADLHEQRDEALELELTLADRRNKREIRLLENELTRWGVLVDSVLGPTATVEFDNQTLAVLLGRLVRYLMRSKEITFGRSAKDFSVDVDLSLEGAAAKISRRQGTIKLRSNGDFFICNEGKRAIFIDGVPLLQGNKTRLAHNCTVEIAGLRFAFLVNYELINAIRQESAKTSNALN